MVRQMQTLFVFALDFAATVALANTVHDASRLICRAWNAHPLVGQPARPCTSHVVSRVKRPAVNTTMQVADGTTRAIAKRLVKRRTTNDPVAADLNKKSLISHTFAPTLLPSPHLLFLRFSYWRYFQACLEIAPRFGVA